MAGFTISGTQILDPGGRNFLPIGANIGINGNIGFSQQDNLAVASTNHVNDILAWKWNTVRICVYVSPSATTWIASYTVAKVLADVYSVVNAYTAKNIVCIVEAHDLTGKGRVSSTEADFDYFWTQMANTYKNNPFVWFNYANEPFWNQPVTDFVGLANRGYNLIRNLGADNIYIIDAPNMGQDAGWDGAPRLYDANMGPAILSGKSNVLFSMHAYGGIGDQTAQSNYYDTIHNAGMALMIGEAGHTTDGSTSGGTFEQNQTGYNSARALAVSKNVGMLWWIGTHNDKYSLKSNNGPFWSPTPGGSLSTAGTSYWTFSQNNGALATTTPGSTTATPPTATTGTATNITSSGARLVGTVDPNTKNTTYRFEWGSTTAYGTQTTQGTVLGTATVSTVSADLTNLAAGTYHFRLIASNADGSSTGADGTFVISSATGTGTTPVSSTWTEDIDRGMYTAHAEKASAGTAADVTLSFGTTGWISGGMLSVIPAGATGTGTGGGTGGGTTPTDPGTGTGGGGSTPTTPTDTTPPDAPTLLGADGTSSGIVLHWNPSTATDLAVSGTYRIERSTNGSLWTVIASTSQTTYTDSTAAKDTGYYYRVKAIDDEATPNVSPPSNAVFAVLSSGTPAAGDKRGGVIAKLPVAALEMVLQPDGGLLSATQQADGTWLIDDPVRVRAVIAQFGQFVKDIDPDANVIIIDNPDPLPPGDGGGTGGGGGTPTPPATVNVYAAGTYGSGTYGDRSLS